MKITIIIPNFNGKYLLAKNLPRLMRFFPKAKIIVVDDASIDGTKEFLKKKFPQIQILSNEKNKGFSSSANKGIKKAKTPFVFLLNNDCLPQKNFLADLLPYFKDKKTFAVSCLEKQGSYRRGRGVGGVRRGLLFHQAGSLDKNNTLWAFGASTLYRKSVFRKLGGFDENFNPFYWEDFDLSYRALKSGYKIYFEKKAVVNHRESTTIKKYYSSFQIQIISFRNQLLTYWKDITDFDLICQHFFWLPYHLIFTSLKTKGAFLMGFIGALIKLPKTLFKKRKNNFLLSDRKILKRFQNEI